MPRLPGSPRASGSRPVRPCRGRTIPPRRWRRRGPAGREALRGGRAGSRHGRCPRRPWCPPPGRGRRGSGLSSSARHPNAPRGPSVTVEVAGRIAAQDLPGAVLPGRRRGTAAPGSAPRPRCGRTGTAAPPFPPAPFPRPGPRERPLPARPPRRRSTRGRHARRAGAPAPSGSRPAAARRATTRIRGSRSHRMVRSPEPSSTRITANWDAAPADRPNAGEVDSLLRKEAEGEPPVLVVPHVPDIHAPAPPSRKRGEGGRDLAASLPRERRHPQLLARHREPRQPHEVIDRVEPDPDDVEHPASTLRRLPAPDDDRTQGILVQNPPAGNHRHARLHSGGKGSEIMVPSNVPAFLVGCHGPGPDRGYTSQAMFTR